MYKCIKIQIIIFYIRINFYDAWIRVGRWGVRRRGSGVINPRQSPIVIWSSNMQIHNTDPPFFCQPASQTVLVTLRQHEILINANLKCVQANTYVITGHWLLNLPFTFTHTFFFWIVHQNSIYIMNESPIIHISRFSFLCLRLRAPPWKSAKYGRVFTSFIRKYLEIFSKLYTELPLITCWLSGAF